MPIEVEDTDGTVIEFPDGTDRETIRGVMTRRNMDFSRPVEAVRADVNKLTGKQRDLALRDWANAFVKKEREAGGVGQAVDDTVRTLARGTFVGPWLDEITAKTSGIAHNLTGGAVGSPEDETLAYQRAKDRAFDKEHPIASVAGQLAGGLAGGGAAMKAGGNLLDKGLKVAAGGPLAAWTPAGGIPGRMTQGGATGAVYGYNAGVGNAEGAFSDRQDSGRVGATIGGVLGTVAPPVIQGMGWLGGKAADAASPQIARASQNIDNLRSRFAMRMSADGGSLPSGADAAADQIIANQLSRGGVTVPQIRQRMAEAEQAALYHGSAGQPRGRSMAQNVTAPVDLDPSLQRLAGSVARQSPEAGTIGQSFQYARQTGQPSGLDMPSTFNLPVRPAMARPSPGEQPSGQFERVTDAFRRALNIEDSGSHGHGRTAFETDNIFVSRARAGAAKDYGASYAAAQNYNLRPVLEPVLTKWMAESSDQPEAVSRAIRQFLRQFQTETGPVTSLQRFQKAKEFADGIIEKWMKAPEGRNRYVGGVLSEIQRDMLAAVDGIQDRGIGSLYQAARNNFAGEMSLRNALKLGRQVFRDDAEVAVDQYRMLATEGERKAFRLGLWDSFRQQAGRRKRTDDITQLFQSPRVQEILEAVVPRSKNGTFADRPERFGRYVANERRMISTRNETLGNSKTAERLSDDQALDNMQTMIDAARETMRNPSTSGIVMRMVEGTLNRLFGFRADTAASIARKLYTADPLEQARLWWSIEQRLGPTRADQLSRLMRQYQQSFAQPSSGVAGGLAGQE